MLKLRLLWCLLALPLFALAQTEPARLCRWLKPSASPQPLDSLSVLPPSISLSDSSLQWHYNLSAGTIYFAGKLLPDSVLVCYQTLPYALHQPFQHKTLAIYDSLAPYNTPLPENSALFKAEELFSADDVQKSGSISRGISFGNTQDVFVQSALNLQLEGRLTSRIGLRASITDQNIPFQPDGNTQNLQEFDKVFVELFTDSSQLVAGDLQLRQAGGSFLRYQRNVQGLSFRTTANWLGSSSKFQPDSLAVAAQGNGTETVVSVAAARGQFMAAELQAVEGMLGPYRLGSPGNQQYVMVLANSERVFLDGRLLQRGYQYDYVIDYNLGEISFTPGTIITRFSRIRVEYEIADQQYRRGILTGSHAQQRGRFGYFAGFYQEKDNRFDPLFFELSEQDMIRLSLAGDTAANAWAEAWDSVGYSPDMLRYRMTDTLDAAGVARRIFVYSQQPEDAQYQVAFSMLGEGKGNYQLQEITPQGRVYQWVSPLNGVPQGAYEPIRLLEAPKKRQLINTGGSYRLGRWGKAYAEMAFSDQDRNLFSELDEADDRGWALKGGYALAGKPVFFDRAWHWKAGAEWELTNRNFTPIDRFRSVEYDRYWGLLAQQGWGVQPLPYQQDDQLLSLWGGMEKDQFNKLHYTYRHRQLPGLVQGWQQELEGAKTFGIWAGSANLFLMQNKLPEQQVFWQRLQLEQYLNLPQLVPGYAFMQERNTYAQPQTDSVITSAQYFREHRFYVKSPVSAKSRYLLEYSLRQDEQPVLGEMQAANHARQTRLQWFSSPDLPQQLSLQLSYRQSEVLLDSLAKDNEERILTGQFQWNSLLWAGAFRQQLLYSAGSGREIRRDYVYVKVPAGQGTHAWRDNNGDGNQQLEEFFEAVLPDEKLYIRLLVPGTALTQAYSAEIQYRLNLTAPAGWLEKEGLLRLLQPFSAVVNLRLSQKLMEGASWQRFIPGAGALEGADLLNRRQQWNINAFYNRSNPLWGLEGAFTQNTRKQLLSGGYELGDYVQYLMAGRRSFARSWNLRLQGIAGEQEDLSDFLKEQQYKLYFWGLEPQLTWRPSQQLELDLSFRFRHKENQLWQEVQDKAGIKEAALGFLLSRQLTTSVRGQLRLVQIDFTGSTNTAVSYVLLEALRPGSNWTWNLQLQQRLMRGLMLNVVYDGRLSEQVRAVHTGRMMLRALF